MAYWLGAVLLSVYNYQLRLALFVWKADNFLITNSTEYSRREFFCFCVIEYFISCISLNLPNVSLIYSWDLNLIIIAPACGLEPNGAKASASTMLNKKLDFYYSLISWWSVILLLFSSLYDMMQNSWGVSKAVIWRMTLKCFIIWNPFGYQDTTYHIPHIIQTFVQNISNVVL